jgi:hypothetical protein
VVEKKTRYTSYVPYVSFGVHLTKPYIGNVSSWDRSSYLNPGLSSIVQIDLLFRNSTE